MLLLHPIHRGQTQHWTCSINDLCSFVHWCARSTTHPHQKGLEMTVRSVSLENLFIFLSHSFPFVSIHNLLRSSSDEQSLWGLIEKCLPLGGCGWLGSISKTARHVCNPVFHLRSKIRSLGSWWKNHTVPQQPGTSSSSCSPTCSTLLWHCIPVCHSQVSRCGGVGKCSLCSVTELIPPGPRWLWVWAAARTLCSLVPHYGGGAWEAWLCGSQHWQSGGWRQVPDCGTAASLLAAPSVVTSLVLSLAISFF